MRLTRVLSPVLPVSLLVLVTGLHVAARAATFERTWFWGPNSNSRGWTVEQTPDGGYVVGAYISNGKSYICLLKTDSLGDTVWTRAFGGRRYPDSVQGYHSGQACRLRGGGYAIEGIAFRQTTMFDVIIFGVSPDGDSLWNYQYVGPGIDDQVQWLAGTYDGGLIASGFLTGLPVWNMAFIKLDSAGSLQWLRVINVNPPVTGHKCLQTRDSGYAAIGTADTSGHVYFVHLVKLTAAGDSQWVRTYWEPAPPNSFCQTYDDGFMLVGYHPSSARIMRTDRNGDSLWTRTLGLDISLVTVAETEDRGFIMAGISPTDSLMLVRTDSLGEVLWTRGFLPSFAWHASPFDVKQTADRGFVVTGDVEYLYVYLVKTDSLGHVESAVEEGYDPNLRSPSLTLSQYPNPAPGQVVIRWQVPVAQRVELNLYDATGRLVRNLFSTENGRAGRVALDTKSLSAGFYFIRVETASGSATRKLVIQ